MPNYLFRFDREQTVRFDAATDAAAAGYARDLLHDEGADEGDGGSLYLVSEGEGERGDEEFVREVRLGDDCDCPIYAEWHGNE